MAKTKAKKTQELNKLIENLKSAKTTVLADFQGLKVTESEDLRSQLRKEKIDYCVAKKTLLNLAIKEAGIEDISAKSLEGGLSLAFGAEDEVAPARALNTFSKNHEAIKILGGIFENKFVSKEKIIELANLPTREELIAKTIGSIKSPLSGFVNVLSGNLRGLVNVLKAISEKA